MVEDRSKSSKECKEERSRPETPRQLLVWLQILTSWNAKEFPIFGERGFWVVYQEDSARTREGDPASHLGRHTSAVASSISSKASRSITGDKIRAVSYRRGTPTGVPFLRVIKDFHLAGWAQRSIGRMDLSFPRTRNCSIHGLAA